MKRNLSILIVLLILSPFSFSLENTKLPCTIDQKAAGFLDIVLDGWNTCISAQCLDQVQYLLNDIATTNDFLEIKTIMKTTQVSLKTANAYCPSTDKNCFSDSCIDIKVAYDSFGDYIVSYSKNKVNSFDFAVDQDVIQFGPCNFNFNTSEYTCSILVLYGLKNVGDIGLINSVQTSLVFKEEETDDVVGIMGGDGSIDVICPVGNTNCTNDEAFTVKCSQELQIIHRQMEVVPSFSGNQFTFDLKFPENSQYVSDCFEISLSVNDQNIIKGTEELNQWSMKTEGNIDMISVKFPNNNNEMPCGKKGSVYDCDVKVDFSFKGSEDVLQNSIYNSVSLEMDGNEQNLLSVGVEEISLQQVQQSLNVCADLACGSYKEGPYEYFVDESIYVEQKVDSVSEIFLDVVKVKLGGKEVSVTEKNGSQSGRIVYGFKAAEVSNEEVDLEVVSKVVEQAVSTTRRRVLNDITITNSNTFGIENSIKIQKLKEKPQAPPGNVDPPVDGNKDDDDGDSTALIIILVLVSLLLLIGAGIGVYKYLESKGKFDQKSVSKVVPQQGEQQVIEVEKNNTLGVSEEGAKGVALENSPPQTQKNGDQNCDSPGGEVQKKQTNSDLDQEKSDEKAEVSPN